MIDKRMMYAQGRRVGFRGGGMDMGNESNQAQSASMGNSTSNNTSNDSASSSTTPVVSTNNTVTNKPVVSAPSRNTPFSLLSTKELSVKSFPLEYNK